MRRQARCGPFFHLHQQPYGVGPPSIIPRSGRIGSNHSILFFQFPPAGELIYYPGKISVRNSYRRKRLTGSSADMRRTTIREFIPGPIGLTVVSFTRLTCADRRRRRLILSKPCAGQEEPFLQAAHILGCRNSDSKFEKVVMF
jgi:hypothetical protein